MLSRQQQVATRPTPPRNWPEYPRMRVVREGLAAWARERCELATGRRTRSAQPLGRLLRSPSTRMSPNEKHKTSRRRATPRAQVSATEKKTTLLNEGR
jgi:hypothetical protein